jgi:hypothetical protein
VAAFVFAETALAGGFADFPRIAGKTLILKT